MAAVRNKSMGHARFWSIVHGAAFTVSPGDMKQFQERGLGKGIELVSGLDRLVDERKAFHWVSGCPGFSG